MENNFLEFIKRVSKNPKLKEELKKNPKKILEQECGMTYPAETTVTILEESPQKYYFVIPSENKAKKLAEQSKKWESPLATLFQKIAVDPQFRKRFKEDPKKILTQETQLTLSENCTVEAVEEESDRNVYLIIPYPEEREILSEMKLHQSQEVVKYSTQSDLPSKTLVECQG